MKRVVLSRAISIVLLAACAASAAGCAKFWADLRRGGRVEDRIHARVREHVYHVPIAQVWPEVRKLLFEQGFQVVESDVGGSFAVETEPKPTGVDTSVRYLALGTKLDETSCRAEFTRLSTSKFDTSSDRDLDLEWKLLQRVDPASAARIEAEAEAAEK